MVVTSTAPNRHSVQYPASLGLGVEPLGAKKTEKINKIFTL
jgi:hypothetical protein